MIERLNELLDTVEEMIDSNAQDAEIYQVILLYIAVCLTIICEKLESMGGV